MRLSYHSVSVQEQAVRPLPTIPIYDLLETRWIQPLTHPRPLGQLMHPLPIPSHLLIKHCIFILWQHLRLRRHLGLPARNQLDRL